VDGVSAPLASSWDALFSPAARAPAEARCVCCHHLLSEHVKGLRTYCEQGLCCCTRFCGTAAEVTKPQVLFLVKKEIKSDG
jgi:hypothetical protein